MWYAQSHLNCSYYNPVNLIRLVVDFFLNSNMEDGKVRYCVFLLCQNEIQKKMVMKLS